MTGEVYFEVAHDNKHPFKVRAGGQTIEDIGTHFNVNAYSDEPAQVTTLLEGAVKIGGHLLRPGEKASVTAAGAIAVAKGDTAQAVAWKNGVFDFSDAGLETVMRQLARWYNVEVIYEGTIPPRQTQRHDRPVPVARPGAERPGCRTGAVSHRGRPPADYNTLKPIVYKPIACYSP